jgi:hypothetical protein
MEQDNGLTCACKPEHGQIVCSGIWIQIPFTSYDAMDELKKRTKTKAKVVMQGMMRR